MDITDSERTLLAGRIQAERMRQFGSKSAAYQTAGLNSATWDRIEAGQVVRDDRLIAAVRTLWPSSGGDWRKIDESSSGISAAKDDDEPRIADCLEQVKASSIGTDADGNVVVNVEGVAGKSRLELEYKTGSPVLTVRTTDLITVLAKTYQLLLQVTYKAPDAESAQNVDTDGTAQLMYPHDTYEHSERSHPGTVFGWPEMCAIKDDPDLPSQVEVVTDASDIDLPASQWPPR